MSAASDKQGKTGGRRLQVLLVSGVWVCAALLLPIALGAGRAYWEDGRSAAFTTLDVERLNIRDPDGTIRLAITNRAHAPGVVYRGKTYGQRSIDDLVGLVFYEANGDEAGGLVLAKLGDRKQSALIFDYTYQLTDGIGLVKRESEDGENWGTGLFLTDRRTYQPGDVTSTQGVERIWLVNRDGNAALEISDPQGRPRIRIGVNAKGEPAILVLDEEGRIVSNAAESGGGD